MCLTGKINDTEVPDLEAIRYKVVRKLKDGSYTPTVANQHWTLRKGEEVKCDEEALTLLHYPLGWHCFYTVSDAWLYKVNAGLFEIEEVIVKVRVRHLLASGEVNVNFCLKPVDVWKYQTILEERVK